MTSCLRKRSNALTRLRRFFVLFGNGIDERNAQSFSKSIL